jgi:hypothetical protein
MRTNLTLTKEQRQVKLDALRNLRNFQRILKFPTDSFLKAQNSPAKHISFYIMLRPFGLIFTCDKSFNVFEASYGKTKVSLSYSLKENYLREDKLEKIKNSIPFDEKAFEYELKRKLYLELEYCAEREYTTKNPKYK